MSNAPKADNMSQVNPRDSLWVNFEAVNNSKVQYD